MFVIVFGFNFWQVCSFGVCCYDRYMPKVVRAKLMRLASLRYTSQEILFPDI
jgi:hypothetical protein